MGRHGARRARSSPQPARDPLLSPVAEPLLESAPLARRLAPQLCRRDPRTRETCAAYHGFWQYARILGLGTAPDLHAGFLLDGIARAVSGTRQPRIAISGAADYSMLAHVLAACQVAGVQPQVTVIDLCETPLALNRWYAERAQIRIDTRVGDAGTGLGVEDQDLICTHALIGNFAPAERVHLFTAWHRALRRGGTVVTVNRLRPPGRSRDASGEKVAAFLALVRSRAIAHELGIEAGALADAAAPYYDAARQCARWPVHSAGELCAQLDQAGFEIVECTIVDTGAEARATALDLPTVPGNARYVQLTAARR